MRKDIGDTEAEQQEYREASYTPQQLEDTAFIGELAIGNRLYPADMTDRQLLIELLWLLRQGEDGLRQAASNPMLKTMLGSFGGR